jgi:hypothetical protein
MAWQIAMSRLGELVLIVKRRVSQVRPSASGHRLDAGDHVSLCQSCGCADGVGVGPARVAHMILILALLVILILRPWRSSSHRGIAPTRSHRLGCVHANIFDIWSLLNVVSIDQTRPFA